MSGIIYDVLLVLWIFWPAANANAAPVYISKLDIMKSLNWPIDRGKTFKGKPLFGKNKTMRGLVGGAIFGGLTALWLDLLNQIWPFSRQFSQILPEGWVGLFVYGFVIGAAALIGDAVESFIKRQINVPPGHSLLIADQTDYILMSLLFSVLFFDLTLRQIVLAVVVWALVHPLATTIAYLLKLKKSPL